MLIDLLLLGQSKCFQIILAFMSQVAVSQWILWREINQKISYLLQKILEEKK